jgi:hypothetical protein
MLMANDCRVGRAAEFKGLDKALAAHASPMAFQTGE